MENDIPHRNKSPYGWWIASYIKRLEFYDEDRSNPNRRCLARRNTILIAAPHREEAYSKAWRYGGNCEGIETERIGPKGPRKGFWRFEGLTSLLPIYDQLQDGEELIWRERRNVTVRKVKSWVRKKEELEAFDEGTIDSGLGSTSPYSWWLAVEIERFEFYDEDKANLNRRCLAWENTILIQAQDREEAYRKAMTHGGYSEGNEGERQERWGWRKGCWRFEGLSSLLPIYEELKDGAVLLRQDYHNVTVRKVKSRVRKKEELETFDDSSVE